MRKWWLLMAVCLEVVLLVGMVLLIAVSEQPIRALELDSAPAKDAFIFLPFVARHHAPSPSPFGVIMYHGVDDEAGLQIMKEAGAKSISTMLRWSAIEPTPGVYDWTSFDTKAQNAKEAGMDLFVLFTGNPSWAAEYPGGPVNDMQDLVDFVTRMAERYDCDRIDDAPGHLCVHDWSFYAEPDNGNPDLASTGGKGLWGHNGAGYAAMLSEISPAIYGADPKARVMIGGLAYDYFEEQGGPFVRSFLSDTLTALNNYPGGVEAYLDAVAFHYYPIAQDRWPTIREKAQEIQAILASHGAGDLPLLSPEMGSWSSPCASPPSSELGQAYWLLQNYVSGLSVGLERMAWYKPFDSAVACSPQDLYPDKTTGLLDVNRTPKPSYLAYKTMTRELELARYVGPFQANDVTGYTFALPGGQQQTVLWSNAGTARPTFHYNRLRLVTAVGQENTIEDNGPGDLDATAGRIKIRVYENQPCYVQGE
jgi:hypothetical protein